ncbi:hypothetical protein GTU79_25565 [Sodalis ligni]|uniref:hypothetical protein n=1 Tax=Sodalis ligni TaxID=2697027 RepID=UPI001BDE3C5D|nr:hypothetical protein [Sodalis ligni]QWA10530.1 hypothetical protein GTU79_25565 [Sodalis ligni]
MLITPLVSPIVTVFSTASSAINSAGIWLNACVHFNINEQWHDDSDRSGSPVSPAEQAESMIPFTEDCRRCVKELIRILGAVKQAELISAGLAKILPGLPVDVVMAAHSLYIAVTEKRNVDMVFLNAMGLASCCTFGSNNPIPGLAHFIRETILDYTSETYFDQYLSRDDGHPSGNFFTALAVFALITRYWLTDEGAPQRRLLKMPIFFGNLLIRVNCYWHLLSNMAQRGAAAYIAPATRGDLPESAFEVDTFVRITHKNDERLSQHTFSKTNMPNALSGKFTGKTELLAFHSNSTVYPESLTKATANNKFSPVPEANHNDAARALHAWSVEKLKQRHKIAELQNCNTKITRTYEREINNIVLNSQLNTKCDAVAVVPPLLTTKSGYSVQKRDFNSVNVVANAVVNPQKSVAGGGGSNDVRIPLMTAAALATTAYAPHSVLSGKKFMVALGSLALTTIVGGARALYNFINSIESVGSTVSGNQRSSDLLKSVNNSDNEVIILRINKKIIRFLRKEKILPARKNSQGNISLEKLIAAVAEYHLNNLTEKTIPLYILNSLNLFVGENTKTLTLTQAESAISSWLFGAILKKNPAEYAYREIMNDKNPSHIAISSIKYLFSLEKLQADGKVDLNDLSTEMNSYFNRFWYRYTLKEMPFLYYFINESGVKSLSPGENEFADLYAGCRYLDSINALGEFNRTEVSAIGEKMWDQAIANGVGAGIQHYF